MNRTLGISLTAFVLAVACSSSPQTTSTTGDAGPGFVPTPSLSAVIPDHAYQGVPVDVTIAGYATNWTTAPTVSFGGSDITVNSVTVASPTALVANITPSTTAATGTRNVTVAQGGTTLTYNGAFSVLANSGNIPSISALSPRSAFVGRAGVQILISGSGTSWDSTSTADFGGTDITVDSITVASPTALVATIDISATATMGVRSVSVTTGSSTITFTNAFEVNPPVNLAVEGTQMGGAYLMVSFFNQDVQNPFDTTTEGDGLFTPITYPDINFPNLPAGVGVQVNNVTTLEVDATFFVDVSYAPGTPDVTLVSGPPGGLTVSFTPPATPSLAIAAQTATELTTTGSTGTLTGPYASVLYSVASPSTPTITEVSASSSDSNASPTLFVFASDGSWNDLQYQQADVLLGTTASSSTSVLYSDISGDTSPYSVTLTQTPANTAVPSADATSPTSATALTLPALVTGGTLGANADGVYFSFTLNQDDVGKGVRVVIFGTNGDINTDAAVDVGWYDVAADGGLIYDGGMTDGGGPPGWNSLFGNSQDNGGLPLDATTPATTVAGTYYVWVTPGFGYETTDTNDYNVIVEITAPAQPQDED